MHHAWLALAFWNQAATTLLFNRHKVLFQGLFVDVTEMNIVELHATNLFQLLLDAAAYLHGVLQAVPYIVFHQPL